MIYLLFTIAEMHTYVMFDLDPFEEFEDTPYSYKDGALAYLVGDWEEPIPVLTE